MADREFFPKVSTGARRDIVPVARNEGAALPPEAGADIRMAE